MKGIPAKLENRDIFIEIMEKMLRIKEGNVIKDYSFTSIKSLHVKNAESFLLKLKLEDSSLVFEFPSLHIRDLAKSLLVNAIAPLENIQKAILDSNIDTKLMHSNLKSILNNTQFFKYTKSNADLYLQKSSSDIYSPNFLNIFTQPMIDIFISMNCSLNQFYNLVISSYFYDIKNSKNSIDRLLSERVREVGSEPTESTRSMAPDVDYATRINSYGLMSLSMVENQTCEVKEHKNKSIEFEPIYPFESKQEQEENGNYEFKLEELECNFDVSAEKEEAILEIDSKDFELARDFCKLAYQNDDEELSKEAVTFSSNFKEMVEGKYGMDALKYIERLLPTFYLK